MAEAIEIRHQVAIAGTVRDAETGRPVAGARVAMTAMPAAFSTWLNVRAKQHETRWDAMVERPDRTRTKGDGHFHFMDLPNGGYTLSVSLPASGTRNGTAQIEAAVSRNAEGDITMVAADISLPPTTLRGRITDQSDEPVALAEARIHGSGERAFSDSDGRYVIPGLESGGSRRTVSVTANGYPTVSGTVRLALGESRTLDFVLGGEPEPEEFSPTAIAGCRLWLSASEIFGLDSGDPVETWPDLSGNGIHATQSTSDKRPTFQTAAMNGRPVVRFDGGNDSLSLTLSEASTDHSFFFVYSQTPSGGHSNYLFDAQTGRLALDSASASAPYSLRWNDGSWERIAASVAGTQILSWVFTGANGEVFRNGVLIGSEIYTPTPLGGRVTLGSNYRGSQSLFEGDLAEVIYYNRAISVNNRERVEEYLSDRYAVPLE